MLRSRVGKGPITLIDTNIHIKNTFNSVLRAYSQCVYSKLFQRDRKGFIHNLGASFIQYILDERLKNNYTCM